MSDLLSCGVENIHAAPMPLIYGSELDRVRLPRTRRKRSGETALPVLEEAGLYCCDCKGHWITSGDRDRPSDVLGARGLDHQQPRSICRRIAAGIFECRDHIGRLHEGDAGRVSRHLESQ